MVGVTTTPGEWPRWPTPGPGAGHLQLHMVGRVLCDHYARRVATPVPVEAVSPHMVAASGDGLIHASEETVSQVGLHMGNASLHA